MSHHLNFLYFDDGQHTHEVINGARTVEHLSNLACSRVTIKAGVDCDVLYKDQCDYDQTVTFTVPTDPDNPAPWWDGVASSPSSNAYGFWIEEWTGLDGAQIRRGATPIYPRGSSFGPLGQSHRVWKMNLLLFGADGVALEELFRWLEAALIQCCSIGTTAWVRTTCPDGYDDDYGLVHVVDVQILEGLEWLTPPIESMGCFMRRVSLTLGVADPCLYRPPINCERDALFPEIVSWCDLGLTGIFGCPAGDDAFEDFRITCPIEGQHIGTVAPVVIIRNVNSETYSPPLRVAGFGENGSRLGEVRIAGIPPQSELMVDAARRRTLWRGVGYTRGWEPGYAYLDGSIESIPIYPEVGCHDGTIIIEPTTVTPVLADLQVTVDMVGRYGCC